jgi:glycerol-1-phosphate dehydrogenase [NAD(P)+]
MKSSAIISANSKRFFPEEQFFSFEGKEKPDRMRSPFADRGSNSMNRWFETLHRTLAREGIPNDPKKSPLVPSQYYAESLGEFREGFSRWLHSCLPGNRRIRVFVDGAAKRCSEGRTGEIDKEFQALLSEAGISYRWTDVSASLAVPPRDIHASHCCLERISSLVREGEEDAAVVLGSGSITDLVKHALHLGGRPIPFVSIPTALTVTAFTSAFAIIDFHGAKRTLQSRPVSAAFWVRPFLECAPAGMSRAGYGDLLARFVAYGDWFLGHRLGVMERYDESAFRLMEPFAEGIRTVADGFAGYPLPQEATACTAAALAMAGISMSTAGETTPLSGFEHVISHALDFQRLTAGRELVFHGEQVALGSLVSARTLDRLLAMDHLKGVAWREEDVRQSLQVLEERMARVPLPGGGNPYREKIDSARVEFSVEYQKKSERWASARPRIGSFVDAWDDIRLELARLTMRAGEMEPLLRKSGLPCRPGETNPPTTEEEFRWAVAFSPFVRVRMNLSDLLFWMGREDLVVLP